MPCGDEAADYSLAGVMLDRSDYIEPERSAMFGRYGATANEWTLVALITRLSTRGAPNPMAQALSLQPFGRRIIQPNID